jgi:hypothetical protein
MRSKIISLGCVCFLRVESLIFYGPGTGQTHRAVLPPEALALTENLPVNNPKARRWWRRGGGETDLYEIEPAEALAVVLGWGSQVTRFQLATLEANHERESGWYVCSSQVVSRPLRELHEDCGLPWPPRLGAAQSSPGLVAGMAPADGEVVHDVDSEDDLATLRATREIVLTKGRSEKRTQFFDWLSSREGMEATLEDVVIGFRKMRISQPDRVRSARDFAERMRDFLEAEGAPLRLTIASGRVKMTPR